MPETAPFQIRDFPVALREEIVREAKANEMSVGDFMTGVCTAAREAGWIRTLGSHAAPPQKPPLTGLSNEQAPEVAQNIVVLVEAACRLASTKGVAKQVRAMANRTLAKQLASYSPALPAPAESADVG